MWLRRLLSILALFVGLALVYRLAGAVWIRLFHPFDLEWMEGGMLAHVWRLVEGKPLYTEPSAEWIPYIYPPGYAQLLAWLSPVFGLGYPQARGLSVLGTVAAAAALPWLTWRQLGKALPGLLAAFAFLGTWDDVGCFYDLARTDGLSIGLIAWAVVLGLEEDARLRDVAALLLFGAFAVKQNFALWGVPMALGMWARLGWQQALRFGLMSAVPALLWTGFWQWRSDGWYLTYIVDVPAGHGMVGDRGFPGMPREVMVAAPGVALLASWFTLERLRDKPRWSWALAAVAGLAMVGVNLQLGGKLASGGLGLLTSVGMGSVAAAIVTSCVYTLRKDMPWQWVYGAGIGGVALISAGLMRAHVGGFVNVLIPLYWVLCVGAAWAMARWEERGSGLAAVAVLLIAVQLVYDHTALDVSRRVPAADAVESGEAVLEALREVEGPVFAPFSPWMVYQAGGEPGVHLISIWDAAYRDSPLGDIPAMMRQAFADQHFTAVLSGNKPLGWEMDRHYGGSPVLGRPGALSPVNGYTAYPNRLRRPRASASPGMPLPPRAPERGSASP
ncbi:MAG: hypothetical protein EP330_10300 [Deltaproteobacteria bacterium]|nr:MAG: hypothetical protein EP330_10300 [Deltaproteobacteria bacterium]